MAPQLMMIANEDAGMTRPTFVAKPSPWWEWVLAIGIVAGAAVVRWVG